MRLGRSWVSRRTEFRTAWLIRLTQPLRTPTFAQSMVDSGTASYYYATCPPPSADQTARGSRERSSSTIDSSSTRHQCWTLSPRHRFTSPIIGYALGQFLPAVAFFSCLLSLTCSPCPLPLPCTADGCPIYGPFDRVGALHSGLDNCNGKIVNGSYGYYATVVYPYLLGCFGPGAFEDDQQTSPALEYSLVDSDLAECPAGMFQSATTNGCELCYGGFFGETSGLTSAACTGKCRKGYYCPPGSSSPTTHKCPAGRWGGDAGMASATCSGPCAEGGAQLRRRNSVVAWNGFVPVAPRTAYMSLAATIPQWPHPSLATLRTRRRAAHAIRVIIEHPRRYANGGITASKERKRSALLACMVRHPAWFPPYARRPAQEGTGAPRAPRCLWSVQLGCLAILRA